ncbi:SsgA family sporulation/cell division regulator [Streptomyces sp. NBC_01387]|uniref:SsgA family sporulation/cell division regulator n=1 Tax=unclassified Streptomyces TaxID=2593676 RepID=UPI0020245ECB|nr:MULTISPECIES: SsgA family sporulation/cell division regulator [unclassified Streptomyces]MCX4549507.1 SsgA family sporulation/cell division regulator [Streptomyces sp. NBC_01500]WSC21043.1 SsgA family sporulation/cell division regulator [Streptomyces sp. NBC_01766]WSV55047.1 SsgA family sporulation/cell division regulator [Streptomyces sp. NBC_01014]
MRESVQAEVMMSFLVSEELSFRIPVELRYEVGDPYAIRMTFHLPGDAPVTWTFGRELLLDGINAPTGDGDVHISPSEPTGLSDVHLRLQVGADRALFRAGSAPLIAFLDRTDKLVPLGQERSLGDFDGNLDEALGRILAEENAG